MKAENRDKPEQVIGDGNADDVIAKPISLPVNVDNVRVVRGGKRVDSVQVRVTGERVSWSDNWIAGADIVLHGIMSDEPSCVYAQLESGDDVRFYPAIEANVSTLFRALSSVAVIAEDAVQSLEESTDDDVFTCRPDGTLGTVDWDAMLAVDNEVLRYQDADEDVSLKQNNG